MSEPELEMVRWQNEFPAISDTAFATARAQMLASGQSVLPSEDGTIYEIFPEGRRVFVKQIAPPTQVRPGSKFIIR